jgi:threonine aldolase
VGRLDGCTLVVVPRVVDLRSDTVTRPTEAMRRAMAEADVGDDGYGEDPTVNELEEAYAAWVGKPAAVFVPSGVMANQIALRVLCDAGDVVVSGAMQHVVAFEMGAAGRNAGILFHTIDDADGHLDATAVADAIDAVRHHQPQVTALVIENTHMASGGTPLSASATATLVDAAAGRPVHLDGARLWNATVAMGVDAASLAAPATTVMSCLSKGLCAPVGSVLAGPADLMAVGRVERKRLGGAMRQAGVLAAAGLVAMRTMVERLAEDHARARRLAEVVAQTVAPTYDPSTCATNVVCFDHPDAAALCERLAAHGVLAGTLSSTRARLVTHADIDDAQLDIACDALAGL